jgi:DNA invertase Pin-like site-specific DNA recombinase
MIADLKTSLTCDVNAETLALALKSVLDGYNVNPKFKGAEKGNKRAKKRALSDEEILKRRAAGESVHSIATACGVSDMAIYKFLGKGK